MSRVGDLERAIQDLKIERRGARNKLQATLDTMQQLVMLDAEQEANEHADHGDVPRTRSS